MFWYTEKIGTCGQIEAKEAHGAGVVVIEVWDLIDGYQQNWGQFESKVKMVEKALKSGKKGYCSLSRRHVKEQCCCIGLSAEVRHGVGRGV